MNTQDQVRLLSSVAAELECLALAIETCARMDRRAIRDGEIIDAPADLQFRRAEVIRKKAALVKAVAQAIEMPAGCNRDGQPNNDPCGVEGHALKHLRDAEPSGLSGAASAAATKPVLAGTDSERAGIKPGHGSNYEAGEAAAKGVEAPAVADPALVHNTRAPLHGANSYGEATRSLIRSWAAKYGPSAVREGRIQPCIRDDDVQQLEWEASRE